MFEKRTEAEPKHSLEDMLNYIRHVAEGDVEISIVATDNDYPQNRHIRLDFWPNMQEADSCDHTLVEMKDYNFACTRMRFEQENTSDNKALYDIVNKLVKIIELISGITIEAFLKW